MTTAVANTIANELDRSNPNTLPDAIKKLKFGTMLTLVKETITLAVVAATASLAKNALLIQSVRVSSVAGAASARVGSLIVGDAAATPIVPQADSPGVCAWDGLKTLTFDATIKEVVVWYYPAPDTDITGAFKNT